MIKGFEGAAVDWRWAVARWGGETTGPEGRSALEKVEAEL
jgi:hypothetical protein